MREPAVLLEAPVQALPDVRAVRKVETWRHHANDEMIRSIEPHGFPDDCPIRVVAIAPESIADHRLEVSVDAESRVAGKRRPDLRRDAEDVEEVAARFHRR